MKKITLKYYGYRDSAPVLAKAIDFISTKVETKQVQMHTKTKSLTFYADPYEVEALRVILKRKYSTTLITNIPAKHAFFIAFLVKENFYEEAKGYAKEGFDQTLREHMEDLDERYDPRTPNSRYLNTLFAHRKFADIARAVRYDKAVNQFNKTQQNYETEI